MIVIDTFFILGISFFLLYVGIKLIIKLISKRKSFPFSIVSPTWIIIFLISKINLYVSRAVSANYGNIRNSI